MQTAASYTLHHYKTVLQAFAKNACCRFFVCDRGIFGSHSKNAFSGILGGLVLNHEVSTAAIFLSNNFKIFCSVSGCSPSKGK